MALGSLVSGIIGGGASLLGGLFGSDAKDEADDQAAANYAKWAASMKPTEEEKAAMRERGMAKIDNEFINSNNQLKRTLASRGLGGGVLSSGFADNTRDKEKALGNLESTIELIGFGNYPSYPAPVNLDSSDYFMSSLGNNLSYMGGMGLSGLLSGRSGGSLTSDQSNYAKNYFGW